MQRHGLWSSRAIFLGRPFSGNYHLALSDGLKRGQSWAGQRSIWQFKRTHTRSSFHRTLPSVTPTYPIPTSQKLENTALWTSNNKKRSIEGVTTPALSALSHQLTSSFETKKQLYNYLRIVIKAWQAGGRVPHKVISKLIDYHRFKKNLQSTRSFNILINLSLRSRAFDKASSLLKEMHSQGIEANMYTFALRIRHLVLRGAFSDAVSLAIREGLSFSGQEPKANEGREIGSLSEVQVPDAIWNELLWAPSYTLRAPRRSRASPSQRSVSYEAHTNPGHMPAMDTTAYPIPMSLMSLNMLNTTLARTPAYIVERLVVMLLSHHSPRNEGDLNTGQFMPSSSWHSPSQQLAVRITERYIKSLPEDLPRAHRSRIVRVINHHFRTNPIPSCPSPFPPPSLTIHRKHRDLFNHFMSLSSVMHPNDETLPLLLFSLMDGTSESAMRAIALHHDFERNWGVAGDGVITVRSRRIVANIALRHGTRFKTFVRRQIKIMEIEWKQMRALNTSVIDGQEAIPSPRSWTEDQRKTRREWSRFCNLKKRAIRGGIIRTEMKGGH